MRGLRYRLLSSVSATAIAVAPMASHANPLNGQVVGGSATIAGEGTNKVTINQSTNSAIINWQSFNLIPGETTQFVQPGASSVTLNRVTGGLGASQINGMITANGGVYVVNPDGILFGPSATVNVGSFLATTHGIANSDFMAGKYNFAIPGNPSASIVNQGIITAAKGGFAALVAPGVRNDGIITANLGTVALASGNGFTLDLYGDNLIKLQPNEAIANSVVDVATGQTLNSLVQNTGKLKANGGTVSLTAVAARKVLDSVINSSGVIEANSVGTKSGLVIFGAATGSSKSAGAPTQTVKVSGKISAAGKKASTSGGKIQITGENIQLANATLDASGRVGGGKILVGGDFRGGDPTAPAVTKYGQSFETTAVPNATTVAADSATILNASAGVTGNGGKVVVWANQSTTFYGTILAKGGTQGGNGGFVETSGHTLNIDGAAVSTSAPAGKAGHWLLDPDDYTIDASAAASIQSALSSSDVIVATNPSGTGGNGDIFVNAPISWNTNNALTLDAYRNVFANAGILLTGNAASLFIYYNDGGSGGNLLTAPGATVTFTGSNPLLAINNQVYTLLRTASDVEGITGLGNYALTNDINLASIPNFQPIALSGTFQGLGHTLSNLNTTSPGADAELGFTGTYGWGLFSMIYYTGAVSNLTLTGNVNAQGGAYGPNNSSGGLAGGNLGSIVNVQSSVNVTADAHIFQAGGLVGWNLGAVEQSSASGAISGGGATGGLVGYNLAGSIDQSFATGTVTGTISGGLAGAAWGYVTVPRYATIANSYATGAVSGSLWAGGLVGHINDTVIISNSYAAGPVTGGSGGAAIGGLIGAVYDLVGNVQIKNSFATGAVSTGPTSSAIGSFTGEALIGYPSFVVHFSNDFATGSVSAGAGTSNVGGLVGYILNSTPNPIGTFASSISQVTDTWDFKSVWYTGAAGLPLLAWTKPVANLTPGPAPTPAPSTTPATVSTPNAVASSLVANSQNNFNLYNPTPLAPTYQQINWSLSYSGVSAGSGFGDTLVDNTAKSLFGKGVEFVGKYTSEFGTSKNLSGLTSLGKGITLGGSIASVITTIFEQQEPIALRISFILVKANLIAIDVLAEVVSAGTATPVVLGTSAVAWLAIETAEAAAINKLSRASQ